MNCWGCCPCQRRHHTGSRDLATQSRTTAVFYSRRRSSNGEVNNGFSDVSCFSAEPSYSQVDARRQSLFIIEHPGRLPNREVIDMQTTSPVPPRQEAPQVSSSSATSSGDLCSTDGVCRNSGSTSTSSDCDTATEETSNSDNDAISSSSCSTSASSQRHRAQDHHKKRVLVDDLTTSEADSDQTTESKGETGRPRVVPEASAALRLEMKRSPIDTCSRSNRRGSAAWLPWHRNRTSTKSNMSVAFKANDSAENSYTMESGRGNILKQRGRSKSMFDFRTWKSTSFEVSRPPKYVASEKYLSPQSKWRAIRFKFDLDAPLMEHWAFLESMAQDFAVMPPKYGKNEPAEPSNSTNKIKANSTSQHTNIPTDETLDHSGSEATVEDLQPPADQRCHCDYQKSGEVDQGCTACTEDEEDPVQQATPVKIITEPPPQPTLHADNNYLLQGKSDGVQKALPISSVQ